MNIEQIKSNVEKLCNQHGVKSLDLYGSVARGDNKTTSDMDFLVEFKDSEPQGIFEKVFWFTTLFGRYFPLQY